MSNVVNTVKIPPFRSIQEFIGGNQWVKPTFNPNDFSGLQKQVLSNLIYYQTNYGAIAIPFLLLVGFFRPTAILLALIVVAGLLAVFVYSTRQNATLTTLLHDRPIVILILLLVAAFIIIRMFGTVFVFLIGIALPLTLIVFHATVRKPNTVDNAALQDTPMGLLLSWLGAKIAEQQTTTTTTKHK